MTQNEYADKKKCSHKNMLKIFKRFCSRLFFVLKNLIKMQRYRWIIFVHHLIVNKRFKQYAKHSFQKVSLCSTHQSPKQEKSDKNFEKCPKMLLKNKFIENICSCFQFFKIVLLLINFHTTFFVNSNFFTSPLDSIFF